MADEFNRNDPGYQEPRYDNDPDADRGTGWGLAALFLLVVLIALAFWGYGWGNRRGTSTSSNSGNSGANVSQPAATATASADPLSNMSGQSVTLAGTIQNMEGNNAFTMSSDTLGSGKSVLVVSKQPVNEMPINVSAGSDQKIEVKGKVQKFDREQMQKEFNLKLSDEDFRKFDGKNVLVADSINPAGTAQPTDQSKSAPAQSQNNSAQSQSSSQQNQNASQPAAQQNQPAGSEAR